MMSRGIFVCLLVLLVLGNVAGGLCAEEAAEWRGAAGAVTITPQQSMWMAGYAARNKPSEGTEQELFGKVLALEDTQGQKLVLVTLDLIGIPRDFRENLVALCAEKFELPAESLLLNASHTHCGPELRARKVMNYGGDASRQAQAMEYTRWLTDRLVELIGETLTKLEPVRLEYTHGRAGFAMNRRLPTERGFSNSPYPDGPVDHEVPVLKVLSGQNKLRAVLFGYACHNTTLSFYKFCGDYAGYAQEYLEEARPGTVCLFMMGCGGDQNPYPRRELALAQQHGRALANAVETALEVQQTQAISGPLQLAVGEVSLEFQHPSPEELRSLLETGNRYQQQYAQRLLAELEEHGSIAAEFSFPVQTVQFGTGMILVALPGEAVVDYSLRLKQELRPKQGTQPRVWVAGYSNYVFGYLPSLRVLREGGYEGGGAMVYSAYPGPFTETVEERMVGKVHELLNHAAPTP